MRGLMMDYPLSLTHFLERARRFFPSVEIVDGAPAHRYTFAQFYTRCCRLAGALERLGVRAGDRVATLAWNHHRHLEAYFAVPCMGAVAHTLNLRLHPDELGFIASDAGDTVLLVDRSLLPLWRKFAARVPTMRSVIVIDDGGDNALDGTLDYEALLAPEPEHYAWPALDENEACILCYTSGTTGNPKGVLYSHRSTVLHTLVACMNDTLGIASSDTVLPVVPMFHANAWGLPQIALAVGAKLVLPGPKLDPASLVTLMVNERVTVAAGVPTIWIGLLALLDASAAAGTRPDLSSVRSMVIGGSAAPASMIDGFSRRHGLEVVHAWGMTETNPLGSVARLKPHLAAGSDEQRLAARASQGYAVNFVDTRHVDGEGRVLPWDGTSMGELHVRGPWVASRYYSSAAPSETSPGHDRWTADGWFKTGDVVTIDADGYLRITDREKDVIKSGGEWISSVALENALMAHPSVLEAAVFAGRHPRWAERPIAAIVLKPGQTVTKEELTSLLASQFVKLWLPDAYVFVAQIPRTSTGKFLKSKLREEHGGLLEVDPA